MAYRIVCEKNILIRGQPAQPVCTERKTHHRQEAYFPTTLPITGPKLSPASKHQMYTDIAKLLLLPSRHISLMIPLVMFERTPEQPPVMMRVITRVIKLWAKA
jgi:hypothetical protein